MNIIIKFHLKQNKVCLIILIIIKHIILKVSLMEKLILKIIEKKKRK